MNKIMQINLGGYALTIDENAYEYLANYLEAIRRRFSGRKECDEILRDIEMRLGELISERLGSRTIVSLADVEAAISVMGKPEELGEAEGSNASDKGDGREPLRPRRRLYRDESDAVIGGVCSGLAAYFGLNDPVWVRVVFVLLALLSFGFWVPAYLLLWILVPPARTAAERLAMRGETPNVENIVREVEQGAQRFAHHASAFGRQAGDKLSTTSSSLAAGCATFLARFLRGVGIFLAIFTVVVLGTIWVAGTIAFFTQQDKIAYFNPLAPEGAYLAFINLFFLVGIPVIAMVVWLMRAIFRFQAPAWLGTGMVILWLLNLVSLGVLAGWGLNQYQEEGSVTRPIDLSQMTSDTLRVRFDPKTPSHTLWDDSEDAEEWSRLWKYQPTIRVTLSTSKRFEGSYTLYARGSSEEAAQRHASEESFEVTFSDNTLTLPAALLPKKGRWRNQRAVLQISVPENKYIVFERGPHRCVRADYVDDVFRVKDHPGHVFQMTSEGLLCTECPSLTDDYGEGRPVEHFILKGRLEINITHDDAFGIHCPDKDRGDQRVSVVRKGRTLILSAPNDASPIRCAIHTSVFTSLTAEGSGSVTIRGFEEGRSAITAKGPVRIRGLYESEELKVILEDGASAELVGEGQQLKAILSGGAQLKASAWSVEAAQITAANASRAEVHVEAEVSIRTDVSSTVTTTGRGKVSAL